MNGPTHYDTLGVDASCTSDELHRAYRAVARRVHPDVMGPAGEAKMAEANRAWSVLSDIDQRRSYDQDLRAAAPAAPTSVAPDMGFGSDPADQRGAEPGRRRVGDRREAWIDGIRAQVVLLARQAGRSATMTLVVRRKRAERAVYEEVVERLIVDLGADTGARIRAARSAGAAPLDLGVAATLVGVAVIAERLERSTQRSVNLHQLLAAELLDRMWDVMAHELPVPVTKGLGGNPGVGRLLADRASAG